MNFDKKIPYLFLYQYFMVVSRFFLRWEKKILLTRIFTFQEFTKAIGLVSHGIGVGSFVYLRRIFEFLIEESHAIAITHDAWDEDRYLKSRMNEKIQLLQSELPEFLVENRSIYSILSKGIHELSEDECLAAFPAMKVGIEIILDEKLEKMKRAQKLEEAKKAIAALNCAI